jgi:hypothetical protein
MYSERPSATPSARTPSVAPVPKEESVEPEPGWMNPEQQPLREDKEYITVEEGLEHQPGITVS